MNLAHPSSRVPRLRALIAAASMPPSRISPLFKHWRDRFRKLLDELEERALAPTAFTAALPLESMTHAERSQLVAHLQTLNEPSSPLMDTPGICQIQLTVRSESDSEARPFGALIVECTHARDREDFLHELFELHGDVLEAALQHCRDYPGKNLRDANVRLLLSTAEESKAVSKAPCVPIRLHADPELHEYEHEIPNERAWIERAALLARTTSRKKTRDARRKDPAATAVRGVHPKHHGLLDAKLVVRDDLPLKFRHGVFKPGASYEALIRVSNMSAEAKPDSARDARGLAIKLAGVVPDEKLPEWRGSELTDQDFLLATHPVFFVKDIRDYTLLQRLFPKPRQPTAARLAFALFAVRRLRELAILKRARTGGVVHPLDLEYHSMVPYALGPWAVKYLVRPATPIVTPNDAVPESNDYLRERLQRSLDPKAGRTIQLEFCLVVPTSVPPSVEDARNDWRPDQSTIVPVATIEIEPQDFSTAERMQRAESCDFTPWRTLRAHRPLGSLSRARFAVYRESAEHRAQANREG